MREGGESKISLCYPRDLEGCSQSSQSSQSMVVFVLLEAGATLYLDLMVGYMKS